MATLDDDVTEIIIRPAKEFGFRAGEAPIYVRTLPGGIARVSQDPEVSYGPTMPMASVAHFVHDLEGVVDLPRSRVPVIDAVVRGDAELLGKGDDGIAFRVGRDVVKMSTTVPYQPFNQGHHLSPAQAAQRLKEQTEVHNVVAELGFADKAAFYRHGDKGFQVKPFLVIPEKLTKAQLDQAQRAVLRLHDVKIVVRDYVQVGLDKAGRVKFFDLGKAAPVTFNVPRHEYGSQYEIDIDYLEILYRQHGVEFDDLDPVRAAIWEERRAKLRKVRERRLAREAAEKAR